MASVQSNGNTVTGMQWKTLKVLFITEEFEDAKKVLA